jgi:hypothetical protein
LKLLLAALLAGAGFPYPPTPIGAGPKFHPPAATHPAGFRCTRGGPRYGVHLELFARNRVVIVPGGIGVRSSCAYPLRTRWPIGVIEVRAGRRYTLGDFFRLWGQPLSPTRLAGFRTTRARPVRAYVGGSRRRGPLGAIPLRRHANIVLQLGRYIPPKKIFLFPRGL